MKPKNNPPARRSAFRWPLIIVAFLAGHAALIITAVTLAVGGTGRGVVPDYYTQAVNFDTHKADLAASAKLGWQFTLTPGSLVDAEGQRLLTATLHDRDGEPLKLDRIDLQLTRLADGQREAVRLLPTDRPGGYLAIAALPIAGGYQADLLAELGDARFVQRAELQLVGERNLSTEAGDP